MDSAEIPPELVDATLVTNPLKMPLTIQSKINRERTWKLMRKGCQNGVNIDAKTHHKSIPTLVSKNIRKIINNHIFLKCKDRFILRRYSNFKVFQGGCANAKFNNKSLKMKPTSIPKSMKNLWPFRVRKSYQKTPENHPK